MRIGRLLQGAIWLSVLASAAVYWGWHREHNVSPEQIGQPLLKGVNLVKTGIVLIESDQGQVTIRSTQAGWIVEEQGNFPADRAKIRNFIAKLQHLRVGQKVPRRHENQMAQLADLGLLTHHENKNVWQAGRTGQVFSIIEVKRHRMLYSLLIGKHRPVSDPMSEKFSGRYVRYPGINTAYLIGEELELPLLPWDWIDKTVFEPGTGQMVRQVEVRRAGQNPIHAGRAHSGAPWQPLGASRGGTDAQQLALLQRLVKQLDSLQVARVVETPARDLERSHGNRVVLRLFDRRRFALKVGELSTPGEYYVEMTASAPPQEIATDPILREQIETFNGRFGGRRIAIDPGVARALLGEP